MRQFVVRPVAALFLGRRVDHTGDMTGSAHDKTLFAWQHLRACIGTAHRHDVVFARAVDIGGHVHLSQVHFFAAHRQLAGLGKVVFKIGIAQVPGVKRPWEVGRVAVPVQQVKRWWRFAFQVVADHVVPHQVVGAQEAEGGCQILAFEQAALAHLHLAVFDGLLVNEDIQDAGVAELQQGCQKGGAGDRFLAAGSQHGQRSGQNGAAHTKTQRTDGFGACDLPRDFNRLDGGVFDVVVPGFFGHGLIGVAPAQHKSAVALRHGVTDQRVVGLQVKNVELVDAGRYQQEGFFVNLGGQRLVLDQLEKFVLEHHCAFSGCHVLADLKHALVGHRHMALLHVVQQVGQALGNTFTLGVYGFFLRLGIERQKVAGRRGGHGLLYRKTHAGPGFLIALHRVGQPHQGTCVEQVGRSSKLRHRVAVPGFCRKTPVGRYCGAGARLQAAVPQDADVLEVGLLDFKQLDRIDLQGRHGGVLPVQTHGRKARCRAKPYASHGAHDLFQALGKGLLDLLGGLRQVCVRIHTCLPGVSAISCGWVCTELLYPQQDHSSIRENLFRLMTGHKHLCI